MKTQCNRESFSFRVSIRWEIVGSSGGGAISSDGGSLLLQQVERVSGIIK